jgi:L-iditol 2-dehydrogenase
MKVAVYYNNNDIRIEERPIPKIGPGELLLKVISSGICGSDVLEWYRIKKAPLVLGHEIGGEIVEVGEGVTNYKVGQRVFVAHHVPCNTCHYCLNGYHTACETLHTTNYDPGGFAQYLRIPSLNVDRGVFVLPDDISCDEATFIEPFACVLRGQRIARLQPTQTLLIIGSGISGLLHLLIARHNGAGKIFTSDINEYRLTMAKQFGADEIFKAKEDIPERIMAANDGRLADLVIVCTGALAAFKQALVSVNKGGTVLFFACTEPGVDLPVPINTFWRNEIKLMPSYGSSPLDSALGLELLKGKRLPVDKMITHRLPLAETGRGFKLMTEAGESLKIIIEPQK